MDKPPEDTPRASAVEMNELVLPSYTNSLGTVFGGLIATTIAAFTPIPASVELWSVGLGIGITALVGLFFGLYPAGRAARLDPIEALRRE